MSYVRPVVIPKPLRHVVHGGRDCSRYKLTAVVRAEDSVSEGAGESGKHPYSGEPGEVVEEGVVPEINHRKKLFPATPVAIELRVCCSDNTVVCFEHCSNDAMAEEISLGGSLMTKFAGSCSGAKRRSIRGSTCFERWKSRLRQSATELFSREPLRQEAAFIVHDEFCNPAGDGDVGVVEVVGWGKVGLVQPSGGRGVVTF